MLPKKRKGEKMKITATKISGAFGKDRAAVVVKAEETTEEATIRLVEKVAGRGAWAVKDSGVRGYSTVCKQSGSVVGRYYIESK